MKEKISEHKKAELIKQLKKIQKQATLLQKQCQDLRKKISALLTNASKKIDLKEMEKIKQQIDAM